jgi:hypothetical protein
VNVFVLKSLHFEKKKRSIINLTKTNSTFNYFFEKLLKIKYFYVLLNKIFSLYFLLIKYTNMAFTYIFINYFAVLSFNLIYDNSIKISNNKLKNIKKEFFSVYTLK